MLSIILLSVTECPLLKNKNFLGKKYINTFIILVLRLEYQQWHPWEIPVSSMKCINIYIL